MNKSEIVLGYFSEVFQNKKKPDISELSVKNMYSKLVDDSYPKEFNPKKLDTKSGTKVVFVVKDKSGKEKISKVVNLIDVTPKAYGISGLDQPDTIRSYIPKVQVLVRGSFAEDKKDSVLVFESPEWVLNNISKKGVQI